MNEVTYKLVDNVLSISLNGRISSDNASKIENEIVNLKKDYKNPFIIIDLENLEYISSAGLRIILRLRKEHQNAKIINASNDIYDIFEMTGFTEMMTIEKAYRKISVDGLEVIGKGANGAVYRLDPETIIKVYLNPDSISDIQRERELARKAFVLGVPTAISYDVVKVGDGYGSVFELLNAKSLANILSADSSSIDYVAKTSIDLLKTIHSTILKDGDMPKIKEVGISWVEYLKDYLPNDTWTKLDMLVRNIEDSKNMIHGDYHIKNVMLQNDEALLIDMDTLSQGNIVFEFAAIYSAYIGFNVLHPETTIDFLGFDFETCKKLWKKSIELYFNTDDESILKDVENKAKVLSFVRILRRTIRKFDISDPNIKRDVDFYKSEIIKALESIDSLSL